MSGFFGGGGGGVNFAKSFGAIDINGVLIPGISSLGVTSITKDPTPFYTVNITAAGFSAIPVVIIYLLPASNLEATYYPVLSALGIGTFTVTIIDPSSGQISLPFNFVCYGA